MFCDFLWDGQSGIGTREDGGKAQENKASYMHRFQKQEAWHMQGYMGKTPGARRQMTGGLTAYTRVLQERQGGAGKT